MLCIDIIEPDYPTLNLQESSVAEACKLYKEKNITALPVLDDGILTGILSAKDIVYQPEENPIQSLKHIFIKSHVQESEFFYSAFRVMSITNTIVPVTDAQNYYHGTVSQQSLLQALHLFLDIENNIGGIIVLEMGKVDYSFSEIARLVESCESNIIQLNTYFDVKSEMFIVTFKVNRIDISEIVSTLQRHDYHVAYYFGEEKYENEIKRNYDALMNYLSI